MSTRNSNDPTQVKKSSRVATALKKTTTDPKKPTERKAQPSTKDAAEAKSSNTKADATSTLKVNMDSKDKKKIEAPKTTSIPGFASKASQPKEHQTYTVSEAELKNTKELLISPYHPTKSDDPFDKLLCALTSSIVDAQLKSPEIKAIANEPLPIKKRDVFGPQVVLKVKYAQNLLSVDWTKYEKLIANAKAEPHIQHKKGTPLTLPLAAGKGDGASLRYRWQLGQDIGGSEILLQILLYVRFSAGKYNSKTDTNTAPMLALTKIRAIFLFSSEPHRNITEETLEAIFQEIRAGQDPKVPLPRKPSAAVVPTTSKSKEETKGQKERNKNTASTKSGKSADKPKPQNRVEIPRPYRSQSETSEKGTHSIWKVYKPLLIAIRNYEVHGKTFDPNTHAVPIPQGYKTYSASMSAAYKETHFVLHELTTAYAPPRWHRLMYFRWTMDINRIGIDLVPKVNLVAMVDALGNLKPGGEADLKTPKAKALLEHC